MIHAAPNTKSKIVNKNIGFGGGVNIYRGLIKVNKGATGSKAFVKCDSLMLDEKTKAYTSPITKSLRMTQTWHMRHTRSE